MLSRVRGRSSRQQNPLLEAESGHESFSAAGVKKAHVCPRNVGKEDTKLVRQGLFELRFEVAVRSPGSQPAWLSLERLEYHCL